MIWEASRAHCDVTVMSHEPMQQKTDTDKLFLYADDSLIKSELYKLKSEWRLVTNAMINE